MSINKKVATLYYAKKKLIEKSDGESTYKQSNKPSRIFYSLKKNINPYKINACLVLEKSMFLYIVCLLY